MNEQKLKQLRDKIISIVPEIRLRTISVIIGKPFSGIVNYRDDAIRLGDVLVALQRVKKWDIELDIYFNQVGGRQTGGIRIESHLSTPSVVVWNLKETYDHQSNEMKTFLYNLLVKNGTKKTQTT